MSAPAHLPRGPPSPATRPSRSVASACRPPAAPAARRRHRRCMRRSARSTHSGAQQAARGIVHQHPVVVAARRARQLVEAVGDRRGAGGAPAARDPSRGPRSPAPGASNCGRRAPARPASAPGAAPPASAASVCATTAARRASRTASAPGAPARAPLPAHGTSAYSGDAARGQASSGRLGGPNSRIARRRRPVPPDIAAFAFVRHVILPPSMQFPASPPANVSRCPARTGSADALLLARFAQAQPRRRSSPRSSPPSRPTRSGWPTSCRSSRPSCASPCSPTGRRCRTTPSPRTRT